MTEVSVGQLLTGPRGAYTLHNEVGRGAFGVTRRATRREDGREVVVKLLRWDKVDDWKALELFQRECAVLQGLQHPGIPAYIDDFVLGDIDAPTGYVLVQEFIRGQTLEQRRGQGGLDAAAMLEWFIAVLEVLHYLHRQQPPLVHRDIAPKNILLEEGGRAHVIDFGAVQNRLRSADSALGTSVGTFGYAPPEQFVGHATPASDIYSLGLTYAVMATGRDPVDLEQKGGRIDVRASIAPLRLDARLALLLERMTLPDPERRLSDAFAIAETARSVLFELRPARPLARAPAPQPARDAATHTPAAPPTRSGKRRRTPRAPAAPSPAAPSPAPRAPAPLVSEPDAPLLLETSAGLVDAHERLRKLGEGQAWACSPTGPRMEIERAPVSADGKHVALVCYWACYVLRLSDMRLTPVLRNAIACRQAAWSADGRRLAISDSYGGKLGLITFSGAGDEAHLEVVEVPGLKDMDWDHAIAVSPDGELVALASDGVVLVLTWDGGEVVSTVRRGDEDPNDLFWSPAGDILVAGDHAGTLFLAREGGRAFQGRGRVAISPNGDLLALAPHEHEGRSPELAVGPYTTLVPKLAWRPKTMRFDAREWGSWPEISRLCFSPDSRRVAAAIYVDLQGAASEDSVGWVLVVVDVEQMRELARWSEPFRRLPFATLHDFGFTADSQRLVVQAKAVATRTQREAQDQLLFFDIERRCLLGSFGFDNKGNGVAQTDLGFQAALIGEMPQQPAVPPHFHNPDAVRATLRGDDVTACLTDEERLAEVDLDVRWRHFDALANQGRLASKRSVVAAVNASAGLTDLLPHVLQEAANASASPRFGEAKGASARVTAKAIADVAGTLLRRPKAERTLLYEESLARIRQYEAERVAAARAEAARVAEKARRAEQKRRAAERARAEEARQAAETRRLATEREREQTRREAEERWRIEQARALRAAAAMKRGAALEAEQDSRWLFKDYGRALAAYQEALSDGASGAEEAVQRLLEKM